MLITPHVFLDTQVIDRNNHNYSSYHFKRLAELVKEKKVKIYLTEITVREVEAHIKEQVEEVQAEIKVVYNSHKFLKRISHPSVTSVFGGIDIEGISEALLKLFRDWMTEMSVTVIPIAELSVETVFNDYFDRRPPFEKRKKEEFPDAFALAALQRWCWQKSVKMYVISNDGGMQAYCRSSHTLEPISSLAAFLSIFTEGERWAGYARDLFERHREEIIRDIEHNIQYTWFWPTEPHEELLYAYVNDINVLETYLIEVEEGKAIFDVEVKFTQHAQIRRYGYLPIMRPHEVAAWRDQNVQVEICLEFDSNDESKFRIAHSVISEQSPKQPIAIEGYITG